MSSRPLLHARGLEETMLLGSDTDARIIQRFVPEGLVHQPRRFSDLAYTGPKKLTRAAAPFGGWVGFSAEDVYGIAELIAPARRPRWCWRAQPRTRHGPGRTCIKVATWIFCGDRRQSMGLNMDVDHVAFAARDKFDGARMCPSPTRSGRSPTAALHE